jgi:hypothetical protein
MNGKPSKFWYLKGALQQKPNFEIEDDKRKIEGFLAKLGFSNAMIGAMNAAETEYKSTGHPLI